MVWCENKEMPACLISTYQLHFSFLIYSNNLSLHVSNRVTIHHQETVNCIYIIWHSIQIPYAAYTGMLISPSPDLLHDVFCLMVRIFRLMLVLFYIYIYIYIYNIYTNSINIPQIMIINRIYESQNLLSLQRPTFRCILFDGENISFDASLVIYINSTNIPPIMIINRIYENQNLLSLQLVSFLVGLRTYQHPCTVNCLLMTNNYSIRNMQRIDYSNELRKRSASS